MGTLVDFAIPESFRTCPLRATGFGIDDDFLCNRLGDCGMEGLRVGRMREGEASRDEEVGGAFKLSTMFVADELGEKFDFASLHSCELEFKGM